MAEPEAGSLLVETPVTTEAWYADDYKEIVTQQGWKSPNDPIRDYTELQKSASGKVKIPSEESSAEEISAFYAKIRGVENPEGYDMPVPELPEGMGYDDKFEKVIRGLAFEAGISKAQLKTLSDAYNKYQIEQYNEYEAGFVRSVEEGKTVLQGEWKENYETNSAVAQRACTELCDDEFKALIKENRLGNHPVFMKNFYNIGLKILDDTLIQGTKGGGEKQDAYKPAYPDSPEMYATDTSPEGEKARLWHTARGHIY